MTTRVAFDLSPAVIKELERIMTLTDLGTKSEVFQRAFTLLRIHINAAIKGRKIFIIDPDHPSEKHYITLPFQVQRE
jgi:hypothetical protein